MDPFSRFLVNFGRSLGQGLGKASEMEFEKQEREKSYQANLKLQLQQALLQAQQSEGFALLKAVDPEAASLINQLTTALVTNEPLTPSLLNGALGFLGNVTQMGKQAETIRNLLQSGDILKASQTLSFMFGGDPNKAAEVVARLGFQLSPEELKTYKELGDLATRLGIDLQSANLENIRASTRRIGVEIEGLQIANERAREELKRIGTLLDLQVQELANRVRKGELDVKLAQETFDALVQKAKAEAAKAVADAEYQQKVNEWFDRKAEAEWKQTIAQTRLIEAQTGLTEQQTRLAKAEADLKEFQVEFTREFAPAKERAEMVDKLLKAVSDAAKEGVVITPQLITRLASNIGVDPELAREVAAAYEARARQEATIRQANVNKGLLDFAASVVSPGAKDEDIEALLVVLGVPEAQRPLFMATLKGARDLKQLQVEDTTIKFYVGLLPATPDDESRLLRPLYDKLVQEKGASYANGVINTIKNMWADKRVADDLQRQKERAQIQYYVAQAHEATQAAAQRWAQYELDKERLELQRAEFRRKVKQENIDNLLKFLQSLPGVVGPDVGSLKNLGDLVNDAYKNYVNAVSAKLQGTQNASCAKILQTSALSFGLQTTGTDARCDNVIKDLIENDQEVQKLYSNYMAAASAFSAMSTDFMASYLAVAEGKDKGIQPGTDPFMGLRLQIYNALLKELGLDPVAFPLPEPPRGGGDTGGTSPFSVAGAYSGGLGGMDFAGAGGSSRGDAKDVPKSLALQQNQTISRITNANVPQIGKSMGLSPKDASFAASVFTMLFPQEGGPPYIDPDAETGGQGLLQFLNKYHADANRACAKYNGDVERMALCQGGYALKHALTVLKVPVDKLTVSQLAGAHMLPKAALNPDTPLGKLGEADSFAPGQANHGVVKGIAFIQGKKSVDHNQVTGRDIMAFYTYKYLNVGLADNGALGQLFAPLSDFLSQFPPEARRAVLALTSYAAAYYDPRRHNVDEAIQKALQKVPAGLGHPWVIEQQNTKERFKTTFTQIIPAIMVAGVARQLGRGTW